MKIEIEDDRIISITIGGKTLALYGLELSELENLRKHIGYLEKYVNESVEEKSSWTEDELKEFLSESSKKQREFLIKLANDKDGYTSKEIVEALPSIKSSQAIAGILAGITKRTKLNYRGKESIFNQEWIKDQYKYWIKKEYFDIVKSNIGI